MSGSATLTTVMSSSSMKVATATAINVHHFRSTASSSRRPPVPDPRTIGMPGSPPAEAAGVRAEVCETKPYAGQRGRPISRSLSRVGSAQVLPQEGHDLAPQRRRRPWTVGRAVVREERMARALVFIHFDLLAAPPCALSQLLADRRGGVLVLGADRREQRAFELLGQLERGSGPYIAGALLRRGVVDEAAPAVHRGIQAVARAGEQQRVAPAHAKADAAQLSA